MNDSRERCDDQTDNGKSEVRKRFEMGITVSIIGALLTGLVYASALVIPFPSSWGVPGFIVFLGVGATLFMLFGAFFAPTKDGESL